MKENIHHVKASTQYKREHKSDYGREKISIIYEDNDVIVIEKPSGLLSVPYPGSKSRTAIDLIEKIMRSKGTYTASHKPYVVHRLDRDTSGVMMFALNEASQKKLMHGWHKIVTERLYHAVAENPRDKKKILPDSGLIDAPLAKNAFNVGYVKNRADDKAETVNARTNYRVLLRGPTHTLFELSLDTGKKNQIRAHLSSVGYPLAGDENYRAKTDPFHRLCLHARTLEFIHPGTNKKLHFEIPEPAEWQSYVESGDFSPQKPVWKTESVSKADISGKSFENLKNINELSKTMRRKQRGMDFIQRGKMSR